MESAPMADKAKEAPKTKGPRLRFDLTPEDSDFIVGLKWKPAGIPDSDPGVRGWARYNPVGK